MTVSLHGPFNLRNQQAFQRLLDTSYDRASASAGLSSSAGKSWSKQSSITSVDVNAVDWLGRTVLHLACSSMDRIEYVRLLLRHPSILVNVPDRDSHWTPLHRALYNGNLPAALLLLQRSDIDTSLKDLEGCTALDVYNSTVEGTAPDVVPEAELFTWGANRNAALGLGDSDDRAHPDFVSIASKEDPERLSAMPLVDRFSPILARQVQMSRLHTVVVTNEGHANIRVCGFGSGGRLGPGQHTQFSLKPLSSLSVQVVSVALGQDHTLALTATGEVYSWGLSRFSQLGYVVESTPGIPLGRLEEPIQSTPRKIHGSLKKEFVKGVSATKTASACWTATEVFTWGTNNGQLGYDKTSQPVQVLPRIVTRINKPVLAIALTDSAMACLLETQDVVCICGDRSFKINFPTHGFPSEIQPYRPPQAAKAANIAKITANDDLFAALSSNGELFTFAPNSLDPEGKGLKPQRVWALKKQFSAVKDVAIGSEGSIIICTKSGHVFVRSRTNASSKSSGAVNNPSGISNSGKAFKFQRIPFIQRATMVCANSTGAFAALRADHKKQPILVHGNSIGQDLALIRPYLKLPSRQDDPRRIPQSIEADLPILSSTSLFEDEMDEVDSSIEQDYHALLRLCALLGRLKAAHAARDAPGLFSDRMVHGADIMIQVGSGMYSFPAHRTILVARCPTLGQILDSKVIKDKESNINMRLIHCGQHQRLHITGCQPLSVLILLDYLYTDSLWAIWDHRLTILSQHFVALNILPSKVRQDLLALTRLLSLNKVLGPLAAHTKTIVQPSLVQDLTALYQRAQLTNGVSDVSPDVLLQLKDRDVYCHSIILRSRSTFFSAFFDDWIEGRHKVNGVLVIDFKHLHFHVMDFVLRFLCCGQDSDMFERLDFVNSVDDILEFMFQVLAAANELLLDRLILLCSETILQFADLNNICYILTEATHFHVPALIQSVQAYMLANLESLLESHILDSLSPGLVKQFSLFVIANQVAKSPVTRTNAIFERAMSTPGMSEWLALQDIPQPIIQSHRPSIRKESTRLSPLDPTPVLPRRAPVQSIPGVQAQVRPRQSTEDIFSMDDIQTSVTSETVPSTIWKAAAAPRVDMRTLMAREAASVQRSSTVHGSPGSLENSFESLKIKPRPSPKRVGDIFESNVTLAPQSDNSKPARLESRPSPSKQPSANLLPRSSPSSSPIRPVHQKSSTPTRNGKAWVAPPAVSPAVPSPSGMSFVAIQQLQLDQAVPRVKEKQSLIEIQQEEKARQTEEDFLKWWAAEEQRVRREEALQAAPKTPRRSRKSSKGLGANRNKTPTSVT
ncbi:hypothetical protein C8J56DRAFT_295810 [Mycena floridula]|nr:hypothetical protein C8J56DRAFT_295810 [Mycena floridula]